MNNVIQLSGGWTKYLQDLMFWVGDVGRVKLNRETLLMTREPKIKIPKCLDQFSVCYTSFVNSTINRGIKYQYLVCFYGLFCNEKYFRKCKIVFILLFQTSQLC